VDSPPEEQLRRLKNTVMGAAHRVLELSPTFGPDAAELQDVSRELAAAAQRLERLLLTLRRGD